MKSQTKIALTFFAGSLSILLLLSVSVYYFSTRYAFTDFYKRLEIRAVLAARSVLEPEESKASAFKEIRDQHLEKLPEEKDYFFEASPGRSYQNELDSLSLPLVFFKDVVTNGSATYKDHNTFFSGIKYKSRNKVYVVVVSASNYYNMQHLVYLRNIFLIAVPLASLLALIVAVLFSKQVFTPVKRIADRVKGISSENMYLRIEAPNTNDEVSELVTTFNNMLDRLETAFETQNNFISNASHELSTPLTAIIGEADVALTKIRRPEEYAESLRVVLNEAERLEKITRSLLFLAQTGFDGKKQAMALVRTDQLLWDVKETIDRINPNNQVYIDLSLIPENPEKLKVMGNMQLLHLALTNIVSNACKYSSYQPVRVSIGTGNDSVIIIVKDAGIGIPESELKYVYDPFFRASNTKRYEGYGIGLPLARNIIRLHKGTIIISSKADEGTMVQLNIPVARL